MTATNTPPGFAAWLQQQLDDRNWQRSDLARESGVKKDRLSKWLRREEVPRIDAIRVVCAALDVPAVEGMIAAGHLRPEDVGAVVIQPPSPWRPSRRELLDELARRLPDQPAHADPGQRDELDDRRRAQAGQWAEDPDGLYDPDVILGPLADERSTGTADNRRGGNPQN